MANSIDPFELAIYLTGNEHDFYNEIEEKYNINYEDFEKLTNDLIELCMVGESPLTKIAYQGFADLKKGVFLMKQRLNNG
jgi:hypothetical protein